MYNKYAIEIETERQLNIERIASAPERIASSLEKLCGEEDS